MIKKWDVAPAPSDKNPLRHKLLIKGEMKDIFLVVKKLGRLCSRPEKISGDFNFLIYLSKLESDTLAKIKGLASELNEPAEETPPRAAASFAGPEPFDMPKPKLKLSPEPGAPERPAAPPAQPRIQTPAPRPPVRAPEPAPAPEVRPQFISPVPAPPSFSPQPSAVSPQAAPAHAPVPPAPAGPEPFEMPKPKLRPSPEPASAVAKAMADTSAAPGPRPQSQAGTPPAAPAPPARPQIQAGVPPPVQAPPVRPPAKAPPPSAPAAGFLQPPQEEKIRPGPTAAPFAPPPSGARTRQEPPKPEEKPAPAPAPASRTGRARWSVELPLVPTYSFKTLVSGSHNRFAHAAAMAVVENPGMIYNPLLIFGAPGTGKTHFVHAVSYGLSSSIGQSNIFVTDGIKLSRGVDIAVKEGGMKKLEETLSGVKVLIVDDIHLLMLAETNIKHISRWLNGFLAANKQIVVTSVFPPKSLGGLEESAGFQFTQGWMVDLKAPSAASYKAILNQLISGMDVNLADDEVNSIFAARQVPFGEAVKILESMKRLEKFMASAPAPLSHAQLLDMLLGLSETEFGGALSGREGDEARSWSPSAKDSRFRWGMFYPRGMQQEAQFVLFKLHEKILELGVRIEWQHVFTEEYNPDELYGINFKIGNLSAEKNANGVIILGPQPTSALGAQEEQFRHITVKILDSFLVKAAWLPTDRIKSPAAYVKALMDLI